MLVPVPVPENFVHYATHGERASLVLCVKVKRLDQSGTENSGYFFQSQKITRNIYFIRLNTEFIRPDRNIRLIPLLQ